MIRGWTPCAIGSGHARARSAELFLAVKVVKGWGGFLATAEPESYAKLAAL